MDETTKEDILNLVHSNMIDVQHAFNVLKNDDDRKFFKEYFFAKLVQLKQD